MRRWLRRALAAASLAAVFAAATPSDVRADGTSPHASLGTPDEQEALALYRAEKLLTARTKAQAILDHDPRSIIGHYVLGSVLRDAEGSLPRSKTHLEEARRLYLVLQGKKDDALVQLGSDILWSLIRTTNLMDQYAEQLKLLDAFDAEYKPARPAHHAWPLMKLGRYDEARAYAREGIATGSRWQIIVGLNALCAIDGEDHNRQGHYDSCKKAFVWARDHHDTANLAVHGHNAALGALALLRFDEAERFALAGTKHLELGASNPWRLLALLYAGEGRTDDTVGALREMQRWCVAQPPQYRDQKSAENFAVIAAILLAAGDASTGLHFIQRALERPDRRAVTSSNPEQALGGAEMLSRALLLLDAEQQLERASARGLEERALAIAGAAAKRAQAAVEGEAAIATLADDQRLSYTIRPYTEGSLEPGPTWMTGDLVALLGTGVSAAALERARREDHEHPEMSPFFDAFEAEIELARGHDRRAFELAASTFERLPRAEALLRARVAAIGAEGAARAGDMSASLGLFEKALTLDPGVVRRLGLAIPARVEAHGSLGAELAGEKLRRSPRLYASNAGFVVRVEGSSDALQACLYTPSNAALGCGRVTAGPGDTPEIVATKVADAFHEAAFAMKFSLTPTDIRSLDGSTTAAQGSAHEALKGILGTP